MDSFLVLAAKKLINNAEYSPTGSETVFVLTHENKRAALVDAIDEIAENDFLVVSFDGTWQPPATLSSPPLSGRASPALHASSPLASIFSGSRGPSPSQPAAGGGGSGSASTGSPKANPKLPLPFAPKAITGSSGYSHFWNKHHLNLMGFARSQQRSTRNAEVDRRWRIKKSMVDSMARWSEHGKLRSQTEKQMRKMGRIAYGTEGNDVTHTVLKQDMETLLINGQNLVADIAQHCVPQHHLARLKHAIHAMLTCVVVCAVQARPFLRSWRPPN